MTNNSGKSIDKIYSDKTSGSSEILEELHEHLQREQKMLEVFPELINEVKFQFRSFQSVQKYLDELEGYLIRKKKLDSFFKKYDSILVSAYSKIFEKNKKTLLKFDSFITISNSKTVYEILKKIKHDRKKLNVIISESRPKLEGRILAEKLSDLQVDVELITEAAVASKIKNVAAALIGADSILKNGNVINKTGSLTLASVCKFNSIPFYVAANRTKFSSNNKFEQKEMPPGEIWRHSNSKIKIANFYFEEIDKKFISKIFTS